MVHLQIVEAGVNRGLCCLDPLSQFLIVSFDNSSAVRFLPIMVGAHSRPLCPDALRKRICDLAASRREVSGSSRPAPCDKSVSFRKEPSPEGAAEGCEK